MKTLDAYGDPTGQRSPVTTGRLCGMIGTGLAALGLLGYLIFFITVGAAGLSHPHGLTPTP